MDQLFLQGVAVSLSQSIACRNIESLTNGRLLVGDVRLTREDEQAAGYYLQEPVPIPDPNTIREPTLNELEFFAADIGEPSALHVFRPPRSLGQEALKLYGSDSKEGLEPATLTLAEKFVARVAILYAAPNQLSTSVSTRHEGRKPGLHQDMQSTPTYAAGLCLEGSRYVAVADITVNDIDPELLKENSFEARDRRRAAFSEVVQVSIDHGQPRQCVLVRIDEGEMYSGVRVSEQAHDGSSWGQDKSRLALMLTAQPLPPDSYTSVL